MGAQVFSLALLALLGPLGTSAGASLPCHAVPAACIIRHAIFAASIFRQGHGLPRCRSDERHRRWRTLSCSAALP